MTRQKIGITFSHKYCQELNLDPDTTLDILLKQLNLQCIRLCLYWDLIEAEPHIFDWSETDRYLRTCADHGLDVTLAIGRKVPRWPEYHEPVWALAKGEQFLSERALYFIEQSVRHYQNQPAVVRWQVENEPFWSFGHSRYPLQDSYVTKAVASVKALDKRPVLVTDTAEYSDWRQAAELGDELGINIYPVSFNETLRSYQYHDPADAGYRNKIRQTSVPVLAAELQAEAWGPNTTTHLPVMDRVEREKSMSPDQLDKNFRSARQLDLTEIWLWGAEWWIWLAKHGEPEMLETAAKLLSIPE